MNEADLVDADATVQQAALDAIQEFIEDRGGAVSISELGQGIGSLVYHYMKSFGPTYGDYFMRMILQTVYSNVAADMYQNAPTSEEEH